MAEWGLNLDFSCVCPLVLQLQRPRDCCRQEAVGTHAGLGGYRMEVCPQRDIAGHPPLAWPALGLNMEHSLSLAVGDHTDDAHDQQSHTDAGNCQDSLLVQLLSLCGGRAGTEPMEMRIHNLPVPKPRAPSAQDLPASFHPAPYLFSDCLCLPSDPHYTWSPPPLKPIPAQCT